MAGSRGAAVTEAEAEMAARKRLPTLQRNALRRIFDRPDFTPDEVARLGQRRLQRDDGIGRKGLATIIAWLQEHGHELQADAPSLPFGGRPARGARKLERAMRVLRSQGYAVLRAHLPDDGGGDYCI